MPALAFVGGEEHDCLRVTVGRVGLRGRRRDRRIDPVGKEYVRVVRAGRRTGHPILVADDIAAVRRERQRLAVWREHRKAVEAGRVRDALEVRAVDVDRVDVELGAARIDEVRREQDALAVGEEVRRERRAGEIRDLTCFGAVGVREPDVHLRRLDEILREQLLVRLEVSALRPRRAPYDLRAVCREERAAVVAGKVRQLARVFSVGVHAPQLEVAAAHRREDDRTVLGTHRCFGVVAGRVGELRQVRAVGVGFVDVVLEQAPQVALRHVGRRRAFRRAFVGRGVDDFFVALEEVRARRAALARRDELAAARGRHDLDLVAFVRSVVGLEDQAIAAERPVRFCVVGAERQLTYVLQMRLARQREVMRFGGRSWLDGRDLLGRLRRAAARNQRRDDQTTAHCRVE